MSSIISVHKYSLSKKSYKVMKDTLQVSRKPTSSKTLRSCKIEYSIVYVSVIPQVLALLSSFSLLKIRINVVVIKKITPQNLRKPTKYAFYQRKRILSDPIKYKHTLFCNTMHKKNPVLFVQRQHKTIFNEITLHNLQITIDIL